MVAGERRYELALIGLLLIALVSSLGGRPARAGPPASAPGPVQVEPELGDDAERMRLKWEPASVAWPLSPLGSGAGEYRQLAAALAEREAMLAGELGAPSVRGAVEIDVDRAVGVWVAALETIRVRQLGPAVPLRFIRGSDSNMAVVEAGRPVAPGPGHERRWELHQPPSRGALWSIEADEPTRVMIERVAPRSPRYASVEVEQEVLEWIKDELPFDDMPALLEPADDLGHRLQLHAALARELLVLGGGDPKFIKGVEAWRMLAAINELDRARPAVRPYYVRDRGSQRPLPLDARRGRGSTGERDSEPTDPVRLATPDSRDYRLAKGPGRWVIERKGPGQLRISARVWAPRGQALAPGSLLVRAGGRVIERLPLSNRAAQHSTDPDTAVPRLEPLVTEAGEPVGEFAQAIVVLAPGRHDYELELIGGPALLSIEGARRVEASLLSLRGWTPSKRARAAKRALRQSHAPARAWLELLLSRQTLAPLPMSFSDPRFDALADQSPLLAVAALADAAADQRVDDRVMDRLVERVRPWLETLDRDAGLAPQVRGQLRARWLALAVVHGRPDHAEILIAQTPGGADPISELPVEGLRLLAEQLRPRHETVRSPALAVLELARTRAPADEALREQTLRQWTEASAWSRRRPMASGGELDAPYGPAGEWLVPRGMMPVNPVELGGSWLRLELGRSVRVRGSLGPDAIRRGLDDDVEVTVSRRMRLANVHVSVPLDAPEPILLEVDGQRWWSPQLFGVQRHRVAVSEGDHELMIDGPAGTVAWTDLRRAPPDAPDPEELGRRERMWPLARSTWRLPGPAVPGVVRLELRWLQGVEPRPTRITVHQLGDHEPGAAPPAETVLFDPRTAEAASDEGEGAHHRGGVPSRDMDIDGEAVPLVGTAWATPRHDVNLRIAASTKELRFEVEGGREIAASLSLRRGLRPSDVGESPSGSAAAGSDPAFDHVFGGLAALDGEAMLDELGDLSRVLLIAPEDLDRRARRAALLLMLGETGHARADLLRLSAWAEHEGLRERAELLLGELERRFEALIEPREIVVTGLGGGGGEDGDGGGTRAVLIEPAIAAFVGADRAMLEPWLERWARMRGEPNDAALIDLDLELARLRGELEGGQGESGEGESGEGAEMSAADRHRSTLLGELTRAHRLSADPLRARDAGRAWLELYGRMDGAPGHVRAPIAVGLAAVRPLLRHLDDPASDARDAGLAFGLARELEPSFGHTKVRQLAFVAALRSDWSTIDHSEDNAGFERLELPVSELEPTPSARVREALLVAPWSAELDELLLPGRKGVLAWDAEPGLVSAEFWCRAARPDLAPSRGDLADDPRDLGRAQLSLRLRADGRDPVELRQSIELADAEIGRVSLPIGRSGRHRLEVVLGADPIWQCSWRTRTSARDTEAEKGELVEARRRARWWTAESTKPVEFVILGPASVHVEARTITNPEPDNQPMALIAAVERLDFDGGGRVEVGHLAVDGETERAVITESRRSFDVAHASGSTLLLTDAAPYRVRLRTDRGRAVIRARVRRDRGDIPPPAQVSIRELDPRNDIYPDDFDWRSVGPASPIIASDPLAPLRSIGTFYGQVDVGLDDIGSVDDFLPRFGGFVRVGWRRELIEDSIWVTVAAQIAMRAKSPVAGGAFLGLSTRVQGIGARLGATLDVLAHTFMGRPETSVRLYGFVDRPIRLGRFMQLRPGLSVGLRWQSLDRARVVMAPGLLEPHPRVYLPYLEDHPVLLRPELELRAYPFQDMALWTQASLVPNLNGDAQPIDHVDVELGLVGIGRRPRPWVPTWGLSYQLSARLADSHRSAMVLRHRLRTDLGVGVWARDTARIAFGLANQLYLSNGASPIRDTIELWIRVDAAFGRRMRDYGPAELWFSEPWAPRSWADSERQAPSTRGRVRRGRASP